MFETNQQFAIKEKSKVEKLLLKEDTDNLHVINPIDIFCSPNLCEYFSIHIIFISIIFILIFWC